jgi:hypothetical protein
MNLELVISIIASISGVLGLGFAWICYNNSRRHRGMLEFLAVQNDELGQALAASNQTAEINAARLSDQSRRIAWLETRVRQPKLAKDEVLDDTFSDAAARPTMTERRHRVLTLASRGQDSQKIASTLGMMSGEVELIINLNRVAA